MKNVEFTSYNASDERADSYAEQPFWQGEMLHHAIHLATSDAEGKPLDIRGQTFTVAVHEDGLHVSIVAQ